VFFLFADTDANGMYQPLLSLLLAHSTRSDRSYRHDVAYEEWTETAPDGTYTIRGVPGALPPPDDRHSHEERKAKTEEEKEEGREREADQGLLVCAAASVRITLLLPVTCALTYPATNYHAITITGNVNNTDFGYTYSMGLPSPTCGWRTYLTRLSLEARTHRFPPRGANIDRYHRERVRVGRQRLQRHQQPRLRESDCTEMPPFFELLLTTTTPILARAECSLGGPFSTMPT
jgi:hypothetical protein